LESWFGSLTGNTINSSVYAQTYSCTITDANNCNLDTIVTVTEGLPITVGIVGTFTSICKNLASTYSVNVTNAVGSVTYAWLSTPNFITGNQSTYSYTANTVGTQTIDLTVTDANGCSSSAPSYSLSVNPLSNIYGNVSTNTVTPVAGRVILYQYLPYYTKFDSVAGQNIDASGNYNFTSFDAGIYIVKAIPSANNLQIAYGDTAINWKSAKQIIHGCAVNDVQNIDVRALDILPGSGSGVLSGHVYQGPGYGQRLNLNDHKVMTVPIKGAIVKGGRNPGGSAFTQTVTDATGGYTLAPLPNNTNGESYFIIVDIPGLDTNGTYHKIIVNNNVYTNLDFEVDSAKINPISTVSVKEEDILNYGLSVYPNPTKSELFIKFDLNKSQ